MNRGAPKKSFENVRLGASPKLDSHTQSKFYYGTISRTIVDQVCSVRQVFFGNSYELRPPATNMYFGIQSSSVGNVFTANQTIAPWGTKELISRTTALLFAPGIFGSGPKLHLTAPYDFARLVIFCNVGRRSWKAFIRNIVLGQKSRNVGCGRLFGNFHDLHLPCVQILLQLVLW